MQKLKHSIKDFQEIVLQEYFICALLYKMTMNGHTLFNSTLIRLVYKV